MHLGQATRVDIVTVVGIWANLAVINEKIEVITGTSVRNTFDFGIRLFDWLRHIVSSFQS